MHTHHLHILEMDTRNNEFFDVVTYKQKQMFEVFEVFIDTHSLSYTTPAT